MRTYHPLALPGGLNGDPDFSDDINDFDDVPDEGIPSHLLNEKTEPFPMLKETMKPPKRYNRSAQKLDDIRPKLVHCGNHLIDPNDVTCITKVASKKDLYIVKLRSNPNPEFPIWVNEKDITPLIQQFNVVTSEV